MFNKILKFAIICATPLLFLACGSTPIFQVTPLSAEANRIMFSQNKPMGCMLVGEQEGRAYVGNTSATIEMLEESAKNDLLNKCVYIQSAENKKRMVVYFAEKKWSCQKGKIEQPCDINIKRRGRITSLVVVGEIYECSF